VEYEDDKLLLVVKLVLYEDDQYNDDDKFVVYDADEYNDDDTAVYHEDDIVETDALFEFNKLFNDADSSKTTSETCVIGNLIKVLAISIVEP
jgi:hypothetical protein